MPRPTRFNPITLIIIVLLAAAPITAFSQNKKDVYTSTQPKGEGWKRLFNDKDFTGWNAKEIGKYWRVVKGVIDCNAEIGRGPSLKTNEEYTDFVLHIEWRFTGVKGKYPMKIILPDGSYKKDKNGKDIILPTPNADSGIFMRGVGRGQINLWCWPCGSGELWSVRNDKKATPAMRAAAVPKLNADKPVGQWNTFVVTMKGDRVTIVNNGKTVIERAQITGLPDAGPIVLQHHGGKNLKTGQWSNAASLVQFRNI